MKTDPEEKELSVTLQYGESEVYMSPHYSNPKGLYLDASDARFHSLKQVEQFCNDVLFWAKAIISRTEKETK